MTVQPDIYPLIDWEMRHLGVGLENSDIQVPIITTTRLYRLHNNTVCFCNSKGAGLGLFARRWIKKNLKIAPFWGRFVVLPKSATYWFNDIQSRLHGCRDRMIFLHSDFQPIVPGGLETSMRPGTNRTALWTAAGPMSEQVINNLFSA